MKHKLLLAILAGLAALLLFLFWKHEQDKTSEVIHIDTPFQIEEGGEVKDLDWKIKIQEE